MPQVIPFVVKVLATKIIGTLTVKAIVIAAVKVAASYAISRALTKSSKSKSAGLGSGSGSELVMSRDPAPARRIVYGEARVSGPMAFAHLSGTGNSLLHYVILLASHECSDIGAYLIDDTQVVIGGDGQVVAGKFAGKARIISHLGDQTTADSTLVAECPTAWTTTYVLNGIAYLYIRLTYDADVYSAGLPNVSVIIRGKKCYDPRTETTIFTRNPAIILRDYLANDDYGIGATSDEIDDTSFIAAANICDELISGGRSRYKCDGTFTTDAEPAVVIEQILSTMGGNLVYAGGKFRCNAGAYLIPTVTLDEGDLRGPIQLQTAAGIRDCANIVKGTFTSPDDLYQSRDFPRYRDDTHVTEDGEEIVTDIDLAWVSSAEQAQRLAKIVERQSRLGGVINLQCNLSAMRVQAGDTIAISNQRFGWTAKPFMVQEFRFAIDDGGALGVDLVCRETSADVYGWVASTDEKVVSPGLVFYNPDRYADTQIVATLNNDFTACSSANDGASPVLTNAVTTITVLRLGQDDSVNWAFSAAPSSGVTGSFIGQTWTTTGFTADSGYVDITATRSGFASLTVRFTLAKAKAGANGTNGAAGLNSATITLYQRAASAPAGPTTVSTYTFATAVLTGHDGGWAQTVPANDGNPLYAIAATVSSTGATDTIAANEWSFPVVLAANGSNGADGADGIPATANLLPNSDFLASADGWRLGYNTTGLTQYLTRVADGDDWALTGGGTAGLYAAGTPAAGTVFGFEAEAPIQVRVGQRYQASAYIGNHRCSNAAVYVAWFGDSGYITEMTGSNVLGMLGGKSLAGYGRSIVFATAPSGATHAVVFVRGVGQGEADPYVFATRILFGEATDAQTQPSPWTPAATAGADGIDGLKTASIYLYQRAASAPAVPSATSTWTFSAAALTGHNNGWQTTVPTNNGLKLWVTTATAASLTDTDDIAPIEWAAVAIMAENGEDATAYSLVSSAGAIVKSNGGTYSPTTITFSGKSQTGTAAPADYAGRFIVSESSDGATFSTVYTSAANEASVTRTPSAGIKAIRCQMYRAGGTATLVDIETVPIVSDGTNGTNGATVLGTVSGSGSVTPSGTWTAITALSMTITSPVGTRLATFSGSIVNSSGSTVSLNARIKYGGAVYEYGDVSLGPGGSEYLYIIVTPTESTTSSRTVEMEVYGPNTNVVLYGTLIAQ